MLERADVASLAADDPTLHVVGRELDHGHRRLGGVACRNTLECVRDEVARAALRLRARFLLEHADAAREVMPYELLAPLEQMCLRLLETHPRDTLDLCLLPRRRLLQLVLQLPEVHLAIGEPLVLALELDELSLDVFLLRKHALLDLQHLHAAIGVLGVDVGPELDRLLARFDLRLAPERLGLALGIVHELTVNAARLADARRSEHLHREQDEGCSNGDPGGNCDPDVHVRRTSLGWVHPIRHCARLADRRSRSVTAAHGHAPADGRPTSPSVYLWIVSSRGFSCGRAISEKRSMQAKCQVKRVARS